MNTNQYIPIAINCTWYSFYVVDSGGGGGEANYLFPVLAVCGWINSYTMYLMNYNFLVYPLGKVYCTDM